MKSFFTIHEAAKIAGTTCETLRYYDRIGLVNPCRKDEWTGYRYYSQKEIIRLNIIQALRCMDLSLEEIRRILAADQLETVIALLTQAEQKADEKIAKLQYAKSKIHLAKADYENKMIHTQGSDEPSICYFPKRTILLSNTMEHPALENLWNYHKHFYEQIEEPYRKDFLFEDFAGIYTDKNDSRLFAVCIQHADIPSLKSLPAGEYLCAKCTEQNRAEILGQLMTSAERITGFKPNFFIQAVVLSGILQWNYQIQIPLSKKTFESA